MRIILGGEWENHLRQLKREDIILSKEILEFFIENPDHPSLRNHPLDPPLERYWTISVSGDLRILFRMVDPETALFLKIGTHDEIYKRRKNN